MYSRPIAPLALALFLAVLPGAQVDAGAVPEYELKAAFVFNFAVFTEWPQETLAGGAPILLCAGANTAMLPALQRLSDKLVNGHRLTVRHSAGTLRGCHVLVLDAHDRERWNQIKHDL